MNTKQEMLEVVLTILSIAIGGLVIYKLVLHKWSEIWCGRIKGLPPGSIGWPFFGEYASFFKLGPIDFISDRRLRYGDVFKTNIFGDPTIICTDPDVIKYILTHESDEGGFVPGFPQSMTDVIGKWNLGNCFGSDHKAMRGAALSLITGPIMREQLLPKINKFMQAYLTNWNSKVLDLDHKANEMVMLLILKMIAGKDQRISLTKELEKELRHLVHGVFSLAINLPGTTYYKALRARRKIVRIFGEIVDERKDSTCHNNDILDTLLNGQYCSSNNKNKLSDEQIIDLIITLVYASLESVSGVMMMAVKYLHDHPDAQQELRRENQEIRKGKPEDYMISWTDYESMIFTRAVVLETMRLSPAAPGTFRKTTADTRIKGHLIPKGWRVIVYLGAISHSPHIYPDPLNFNPWRWLESNLESRPHFMIFGDGGRLCAGNELSILEISIFLHYLVTKYSWEEVGENKIVHFPRLEAPDGIHFRFSPYN